jgi:hypothetical protein
MNINSQQCRVTKIDQHCEAGLLTLIRDADWAVPVKPAVGGCMNMIAAGAGKGADGGVDAEESPASRCRDLRGWKLMEGCSAANGCRLSPETRRRAEMMSR